MIATERLIGFGLEAVLWALVVIGALGAPYWDHWGLRLVSYTSEVARLLFPTGFFAYALRGVTKHLTRRCS